MPTRLIELWRTGRREYAGADRLGLDGPWAGDAVGRQRRVLGVVRVRRPAGGFHKAPHGRRCKSVDGGRHPGPVRPRLPRHRHDLAPCALPSEALSEISYLMKDLRRPSSIEVRGITPEPELAPAATTDAL